MREFVEAIPAGPEPPTPQPSKHCYFCPSRELYARILTKENHSLVVCKDCFDLMENHIVSWKPYKEEKK